MYFCQIHTYRHAMHKQITITILTFLFTLTGKVYAQEHLYEDPSDICAADTGKLFLDVDALTLMRNAEFNMRYSKGFTVIGFRFSPTLRYIINERSSIRAGFTTTGIAGSSGLREIEPVMTIDYKPADWIQLTFGTLYGSLTHRLGEPMYDINRWIYHYKEDGIQIRTNTAIWESDTWLSWENFLEPWTADQEQFIIGSRHKLKLVDIGENGSLSIPAAFVGCHKGGSYTTLDTCIETIFNEMAGLTYSHSFNEKASFAVNLPAYFYQNLSPEPHTTFTEGWGIHPTISTKLISAKNSVSAELGYWHSHQYMSPTGSILYQSVSNFDEWHIRPYRNMATMTINYQHEFKRLILAADVQFYYDTDQKDMELAFGLYMRFKHTFKLL